MPAPYFFYAPGDYEKWLPKFGFKINTLKLAPKDATYPGEDGFTTWLRTTWIPYTQRVPENLREDFLAAITRRYIARHLPDAEGKVHVRMVRLEIEAEKVMGDNSKSKIRNVSCLAQRPWHAKAAVNEPPCISVHPMRIIRI